jgi:hypothetical protein
MYYITFVMNAFQLNSQLPSNWEEDDSFSYVNNTWIQTFQNELTEKIWSRLLNLTAKSLQRNICDLEIEKMKVSLLLLFI